MWWHRFLMAQIVIGSVLGSSLTASAGWGWPNLNPFSSEKQSTTENPRESGWGLPKLPGFGSPEKSSRKSLLTRTKETLFPWTRPKPVSQMKLTGTRATYQGGTSLASDPDESGESFFSSWFEPAEEKSNLPLAPHEWLGNPMPE